MQEMNGGGLYILRLPGLQNTATGTSIHEVFPFMGN